QDVPKKLQSLITKDKLEEIAVSPCNGAVSYLVTQYIQNPDVPKALDAVLKGLRRLPVGYPDRKNPWQAPNSAKLLKLMIDNFLAWCVFLPQINGSNDNGLAFIQNFAWFYYQNPAGQDFVQGRNPLNPAEPLETGFKFTRDFTQQRGAFMDSPASLLRVPQWINDPRIEIADYEKQKPSEYRSWNEFFARELIIDEANQTIPSRPATMPLSQYPERDYIVVAPTDCIMNPLVQVFKEDATVKRRFIENPLQFDTVLDIKGIPISVDALLAGVPKQYKQPFVGGTGQSCILLPNTYHHFHAPVNGTIVHAAIVENNTYGYPDWPNWVPLDGNVARLGTDFSQFQVFQRGVIIIEVKYADLDGTELTGYVASIPVGLDTIGSVVINEDILQYQDKKVEVKRGFTELGNFFYGGSLNILLYSKGLAGNPVQVRMGNQINLFNVGTTPKTD
ncbi:hypothetical protein C2W62_41060, partial [Candidatus Entotheonella serta]